MPDTLPTPPADPTPSVLPSELTKLIDDYANAVIRTQSENERWKRTRIRHDDLLAAADAERRARARLDAYLVSLVEDKARLDYLADCAALTVEKRDGDEATWGNLGIVAAPMRLRAFIDNVRRRAARPTPEAPAHER